MKRKNIRINLKKLMVVFVIALMLLPAVSVNVVAVQKNKTKAKKLYEIPFDGSLPENIETVKYKDYFSPKSLRKKLGSNSLESAYDNKVHINSGHQEVLDICWAFGNKNLMESFLSKKNNVKLELSARHMDYALSNVVPDSLNRNPGTGAAPLFTLPYLSSNQGPVKEENFPFNTLIETPSIEDLEKNLEDIYLEGYRVFPSIYKEVVDGEIQYDISIAGVKITDVPESEIFEMRDEIKRHIKEFGSVSAAMLANTALIEYPAEEFVYNKSDESLDINHNISIIGWDDAFCSNNPDGSISGDIPLNSGAWLVSDSNQPYGNQFYYVAYDDVFIERVLIGIDDVSIGSRFNVYRHDLLGSNAVAGYTPINETGDPELIFANVFEKTDSDIEYLSKIGFMTFGTVSVDAYYIQTDNLATSDLENEGIKIGSVSINNPGIKYYTMDLDEPIDLSEGEFVIYLKIVDHGGTAKTERLSYIPVETTVLGYEYSNIEMKEKSYIIDDEVSQSDYNFPIRAYTSNQLEEEETFLVSYDLQGGEGEFPIVNVTAGNYIINSQIPTKEGYTFLGWTPDPANTPIIENTVFVANWEKIEETIPDPDPDPDPVPGPETPNIPEEKPDNTATFVFGDGKISYVEIGTDGYVKTVPTPAAKAGYKFLGWNPDPKRVKANEDTVFYGLWEKLGTGNSGGSGNTTTEYTPGTKNDGTQATIRIPDAGKSIIMIFVVISIATAGVVFYIKYKKIDI